MSHVAIVVILKRFELEREEEKRRAEESICSYQKSKEEGER